MARERYRSWGWLLSLGALAACSGEQPSAASSGAGTAARSDGTPSQSSVAGNTSQTSPSAAATSIVATTSNPGPSGAAAGSGAADPLVKRSDTAVPLNCAATDAPFKQAGCSCNAGDTAPCWTGSPADRNVGACHDGLQVCEGTAEFASWSECMGEELSCGVDAGVPDMPEEDCSCVPGAIIQCSEDCSVGIICSLTATKTCLPDGTWSTCREDVGVPLDAPGFQCRNMLHGCVDVLAPDDTSGSGQGELFVGDCSKQFKCGHAPPPPPPPELPD